MTSYVLAQPAIDDISDMLEYLRPLNPIAASKQAQIFYKAFQLLLENPAIGAISEEDDSVMIWHIPETSYSVPYMIDGETLIILRVFHQSQQKPEYWK